MVDRLAGLIHHPVVGRHHQDHDIGNLGTTGAHLGEGLMAGGIEEDQITLGRTDIMGPDMLGNPAGLTGRHIGLADGVQDRGLAVIDMAHHRDHRGSGHRLTARLLLIQIENALLPGLTQLNLVAELGGYQGGGVDIHSLVDGGHYPHPHQFGDNLVGLGSHPMGEIADRDGFVDGDALLDRLGFGGQLRLNLRLAPPPAAASTTAAQTNPGRDQTQLVEILHHHFRFAFTFTQGTFLGRFLFRLGVKLNKALTFFLGSVISGGSGGRAGGSSGGSSRGSRPFDLFHFTGPGGRPTVGAGGDNNGRPFDYPGKTLAGCGLIAGRAVHCRGSFGFPGGGILPLGNGGLRGRGHGLPGRRRLRLGDLGLGLRGLITGSRTRFCRLLRRWSLLRRLFSGGRRALFPGDGFARFGLGNRGGGRGGLGSGRGGSGSGFLRNEGRRSSSRQSLLRLHHHRFAPPDDGGPALILDPLLLGFGLKQPQLNANRLGLMLLQGGAVGFHPIPFILKLGDQHLVLHSRFFGQLVHTNFLHSPAPEEFIDPSSYPFQPGGNRPVALDFVFI